MKSLIFTCAVTALLLCNSPVNGEEKEDPLVEQTTESPIADMTLMGEAVKADAAKAGSAMKPGKENVNSINVDSQPHSIADYIIHPLIALKPRVPEIASGKQADTSSTTPSPWQLFGFNAGQGFGSSVFSLADTVTGWLGNRIQLPGFVDTPVRESSTTSTTTTTIRPDIVVRVQQRPTTKKPLIAFVNNNNRPFRTNKRRFNGNYFETSDENFDLDEEYDDDDVDNFNANRRHRNRYRDDEEKEGEEDEYDSNEYKEEDSGEEDEEDYDYNNRDEEEEAEEDNARPVRKQNNNRRRHPRPMNYNKRKNINNQRKQQLPEEHSAEDDQYDDANDDDDDDQDFYYNKNKASKPSQNEMNFIQRDQQSLINQVKQLTRRYSSAELGNSLRISQSTNNKHGQPGNVLIRRNGQTIYLAPELLPIASAANNKPSVSSNKYQTSHYPQPPLTVPYKRKGQPVQYITIPWSQLGISPPDQIVSLTEGIQSQPLILNIPPSAIDNMQRLGPNKKKQTITADAVPLLAEASIMDIFKPPRIPPARTPTTIEQNKNTPADAKPVIIATRTKTGPTRIRSTTTIEKARADDNTNSAKGDSKSTRFFVLGDELGETKLNSNEYRKILDYFNHNRVGRQHNGAGTTAKIVGQSEEQLIPVKIVSDEEAPLKKEAVSDDH